MNFEQSSVVIGNNRPSSVVIGKNLSYLTYIIDTFNLNRKKERKNTVTPGHISMHGLRQAECELEAARH